MLNKVPFRIHPPTALYFWKAISCQKPRDCGQSMVQVFLHSFLKSHAGHDPKQFTVLMYIWLKPIHLTLPIYYAKFKHNTVTDPHMTRPTTAF